MSDYSVRIDAVCKKEISYAGTKIASIGDTVTLHTVSARYIKHILIVNNDGDEIHMPISLARKYFAATDLEMALDPDMNKEDLTYLKLKYK